MLLERATALSSRITEYQRLKRASDESEVLHTRAGQFAASSQRLASARVSLEKLVAAAVPVGPLPGDVAPCINKARQLRSALQSDPATLSNPPFDLKAELLDRLAGISQGAERAIAEAWKAYVAKRADFGSDDVLSALSEVPQFHQNVVRIRRSRSEIATLATQVPADPMAAVKRIGELVSAHDAAWRELSSETIPKPVIEFIRASAGEGAMLMAYTEEVLGWLRSRNLLGAFRIRLR